MIHQITKDRKKNGKNISILTILLLITVSILCTCSQQSLQPTDYVKPQIDSHKSRYLSYYPGKKFVITTENNSKENIYIQQAKLNGVEWTKFSFPHEIFAKGGKLHLTLGNKPNRNWGTK